MSPWPARRSPRAGAGRAGLRRGSGLAAIDTVARARRRESSTLRRDARQLQQITRRDRPPPPRIDRRRDAAGRLAGLAPGLGARPPLAAEGDGLRGLARAGGARRSALRLQAAPELLVQGPGGRRAPDRDRSAPQLARGRGGLHAHTVDPAGQERDWTIPGASRGETGVLGEGIRQALLRDPTYIPALQAATGDGRMTRLTTCSDPRRWRSAPPTRSSGRWSAREPSAARPISPSAAARTPGRTYELPGRRAGSTGRGVEVWFADERCVGPEDEESNYRLRGRDAAAGRRRSRPAQIHRMEGELGPAAGADAYAGTLRRSHRRARRRACRSSTSWCSGSVPTVTSPRCSPARRALDADARRRMPRRDRIAQAAARADHAQPRRAARRPRLPADRDRRRQGGRSRLRCWASPPPHVPASLLRRERLTVIVDDAAAPPAPPTVSAASIPRRALPPGPPDVVLVRHAETEWSLAGRHTGRTDIPLTERGRRPLRGAGRRAGRRSLRARAREPRHGARAKPASSAGWARGRSTREDLLEWDYGELRGPDHRRDQARRPDWDLWRDGCPGGETPERRGRPRRPRDRRAAARRGCRRRSSRTDTCSGCSGRVGSPSAPSAGRAPRRSRRARICVLGHERERAILARWNDTGTA